MLRLFVLFLVIAALGAGAAWFSDNPGDVAVTWHGQRYEMSLSVALFGVLALAIALGMVWTLIRFVLRLPSLVSLASRARQRRKGLQSATKGLVAIGSGDSTGALRHAADARRLLGKGPLTLLLDAQAAQLSGDRDKARKAFEAMTRDRDTKILGLRGLYVEAQRSGDAESARSAANEAVALAPSAAWANEAVLTDRFAERDWQGARAALERAERLRVLDKTTAKRQRAVLMTAEAMDALGARPADALKMAQEAAGLAPDLVPAAAVAGRLLGEKGDLRKATKILEAAWRAQPHPDLADAYVHVRPGDSTRDQLARAETLARLLPQERESALTVAQAALAAHDTAKARAALEPLLASHPTVRACMLMAHIEDTEGHPGLARGWLARAARAPRDRAWVADGYVSAQWAPVSPVTGRLDAFVWTDPPQDHSMRLAPVEDMTELPALVDAAPIPVPPAVIAVESEPEDNDPEKTVVMNNPVDAPSPSPVTPEPGNVDSAAGAAEFPSAAGTVMPTPVVFPVPHAPDDPGPRKDGTPASRRWRVFGG